MEIKVVVCINYRPNLRVGKTSSCKRRGFALILFCGSGPVVLCSKTLPLTRREAGANPAGST